MNTIKQTSTLLRKALPTLGVILCALVLSGLGYPNDGTVVIGNDQREGGEFLYDLQIEVPQEVALGQEMQARVSFQNTDEFDAVSEATVNVTGATLKNEQTQIIAPDAVWKIQAKSDTLVGVVVSVETTMTPKGDKSKATTYLDTLSASVPIVNNTSPQNSHSLSASEDTKNFFQNQEYIFLGVVLLIFLVLVVGVVVKKNQEKRSRND